VKRRRALKVSEFIKREVSLMLLKEVRDPRIGFCTITRVEVSKDLRLAKIYLTFWGGEEEKKEGMIGIRSATPFLQREVGRRLGIRYTPRLLFLYDQEWEDTGRVLEILDNLRDNDKGG